jgi:hypothetical protein
MAYEVDRKKVRMRRMAERMYEDSLEARS